MEAAFLDYMETSKTQVMPPLLQLMAPPKTVQPPTMLDT